MWTSSAHPREGCRDTPLAPRIVYGEMGTNKTNREDAGSYVREIQHPPLPAYALPSFLTLQRAKAAAGGCARPVTERKERWGARPAASSCSELLRWLSRRMSKFNSCVNNRGKGVIINWRSLRWDAGRRSARTGTGTSALPFPFLSFWDLRVLEWTSFLVCIILLLPDSVWGNSFPDGCLGLLLGPEVLSMH